LKGDPLLGTTVAERYQVIQVLGRGGIGVVYKGRHFFMVMDRLVAVKMLRAELAADDQHLQRFQQEARAVSALKHPNIVPVFDFGMAEDDTSFLIMEYLEGEDLCVLLSQRGVWITGGLCHFSICGRRNSQGPETQQYFCQSRL
ncbi:MAG: protein kinase, partial [Candidatus Obscuribacterales bacterium]|nr:protein kinase [Candidatus Obscuribacterales bacterium]